MSTRALILVDAQNDFCTGSLATARGPEVASKIAGYLTSDVAREQDYVAVVATQDWHIDPGPHFSQDPDFVDSWPVHCVAGSPGAALHPAIDPGAIDAFFRKGEYEAAYSGFEGTLALHDDAPGLATWLRERGVDTLDICGIATDHCVRATALDALNAGFNVRILSGMCAAVNGERGDAALHELHAAGAELA
ncbi:isochorismatase family protein [Corynebacterium cystitidis]|uniref:nicotinamidase n=1 Tax=Corynebacterium cystitidis DSM 20524 TaxID=1121357 RepID=A0A1H9SJH2_9CORY|nr:isochorismatase family protein [Corynebacterium cystitidis]WJY83068.1 Isochorismatase family protein YecD [Corynebacterium cystitidis DSM 20524]SER85112.1 nicotinamidase/pyrazinamidase [Corynebacterium cystitidis DSM 20524]SNV65788.1 pyrazinamidase / nicotinamidase [Corynebacterium cystitidis]